jgi:hypothetical protein
VANKKDTHGVVPHASSALVRVWQSILKQNCYRMWDQGFPLNSREQAQEASSFFPVKKQFKAVESPAKVMATFICYVYGVLLVGFTYLALTVNTPAYQETFKRVGRLFSIRDLDDDLRRSVARQHSTSQSYCNRESLYFLGVGNSFTSAMTA